MKRWQIIGLVCFILYILLTIKYLVRTTDVENEIVNLYRDEVHSTILNERIPLYIKPNAEQPTEIINIDDLNLETTQQLLSPSIVGTYPSLNINLDTQPMTLFQSLNDGMFIQSSAMATESESESLVYLFSPKNTSYLYPQTDLHSYLTMSKQSKINILDESTLKLFPKYHQASYTIVKLKPKDLLYVPFGWWYCVSTPCKILRWNSILSLILKPVYIAYTHLGAMIGLS